jgi:hypothetical protein
MSVLKNSKKLNLDSELKVKVLKIMFIKLFLYYMDFMIIQYQNY